MGGEQIKALLVGSLLAVTREDVLRVSALYAAVGLVHWLARRPLAALSFGGSVAHARLWDFAFYLTFGLVVTSSVRIAGVLLVFAYLIVPAVIGAALAATPARRLLVGWLVGSAASVIGLTASFVCDLPPGATIVAMLGVAVVGTGAALAVRVVARGVRRHGVAALGGALAGAGVVLAAAGVALAAVPRADHLWLDALERLTPALQRAFLSTHERAVAEDSRAAIVRGSAEAQALRARQADQAWSAVRLDTDERDRLRQFTLGREELIAGDRLVLRTLRDRARERQRWALGVPVTVAGAGLAALGLTWRRRYRSLCRSSDPADPPSPCA
jgi:zinc/manganese transport system permease protein